MIPKKDRLGVGIRGAGQVAVEHAKAIRNNPHLFLAAVCSRSEESAARLAREFAAEAKVHKHYEDLLAGSESGRRIDLHAELPACPGSHPGL